MGNRAVITFETATTSPCIYLHWNGGRASVEAFLRAGRDLSIRGGATADQQAKALDALAERIGRFFFGNEVGFTIYRETYGRSDTDNGDNGVYVIGHDMEIVRRLHQSRYGEELNAEKTAAIYEQIMARAPVFND